MRVMVTGGAGFIGSTLVDRLLAEGCDVDVIDDLSTGALANLAEARAQRNRKFSFHRLDIRSPQLADLVAHRRPEVIFHLAAQLDVRVSVAKPLFDAEVNVLGSLNVCEAALAAGTRKVVFAGSGGTLYGVPESLPGAREPPAAPDLAVRRVEEGGGRLPALLPRGPRARVHRARARQRLRAAPGPERRGRRRRDLRRRACSPGASRPIYGDGAQTRDYVFVDDVVDAFVRATEKGGGLLMNIGTGVETSVLELYEADGAPHRLPPSRPTARPTRAGELAAVGARSRAVPRSTSGWKPWTPLDDGLAPHRRLVPRPQRRLIRRDRSAAGLSGSVRELVERDRRARAADVRGVGAADERPSRAGATRGRARARRVPPRGRRSAPRPSTTRSPASAAASMRFSTAAPSDSSAMPHSARWRVSSG